LDNLKRDLTNHRFHRVFGSGKLLTQRHETGSSQSPWGNEQQWRSEWLRKRNQTMILIGAANQSFGNQSAQLERIESVVASEDTDQNNKQSDKTLFHLTLRLSESQAQARLQHEADRLGIVIEKVKNRLSFKRITIPMTLDTKQADALLLAQAQGKPVTITLSCKLTPKGKRKQRQNAQFSRGPGRNSFSFVFAKGKPLSRKPQPGQGQQALDYGWYLHAAFELDKPELKTWRQRGVLGADLNAHGISWCICTHDGNVAKDEQGRVLKGDIGLDLKHPSCDQAHALICQATNALVALGENHQVAIAYENLDFARKKSGLREQGADYARMLSRLTTAGFESALSSRATKRGIALHKVNPAYSSIAGFAKYGIKQGFSIDQAAAYQIARYGLLAPDPRKPVPATSKTGKPLSKRLMTQLQAFQDNKTLQFQEPVKFSRPLPAKLQSKLDGQGVRTWRTVGQVLGSRRNWLSNLCGNNRAGGAPKRKLQPTGQRASRGGRLVIPRPTPRVGVPLSSTG
jgi:hypothetical protein